MSAPKTNPTYGKTRYTVTEIDQMRKDIHTALFCGEFTISYFNSGSHRGIPGGASVDAARLEDRLRTYMLAGVRPKELKVRAEAAEAAWKVKAAKYKADIEALQAAADPQTAKDRAETKAEIVIQPTPRLQKSGSWFPKLW